MNFHELIERLVDLNWKMSTVNYGGRYLDVLERGNEHYEFETNDDVQRFVEEHPEYVTSSGKNSFSESLRQLVAEKRQLFAENRISPEHSAAQQEKCPICHDAKYVLTSLIDGDLIPCECQKDFLKAKHRQYLVQKSRLGPFRTEYTFDKFTPRTEKITPNSAAEAKQTAIDYAKKVSPEPWLILYGSQGTGKTHLAASIMNYAIDNWDWEPESYPLFWEISDFLGELRNSYNDNSNGTYYQIMESCKSTPLLILDDLGTENGGKAYVDEQLYILLNHRYKWRLPTVVTTNVKVAQMNPRISSRLQDRVVVRFQQIFEKDYRPVKKR